MVQSTVFFISETSDTVDKGNLEYKCFVKKLNHYICSIRIPLFLDKL